MKIVARLLVLVACGLTVPPPGWCCAAVRWATTVKHHPAACCCCAPEQTPDNEPTAPPARSWCCERDPADPPRPVVADTADLPLVSFTDLAESPAWHPPHAAADVVVPAEPLHLLHCVWRC